MKFKIPVASESEQCSLQKSDFESVFVLRFYWLTMPKLLSSRIWQKLMALVLMMLISDACCQLTTLFFVYGDQNKTNYIAGFQLQMAFYWRILKVFEMLCPKSAWVFTMWDGWTFSLAKSAKPSAIFGHFHVAKMGSVDTIRFWLCSEAL